jgi:membrane fusion protein (multidrug efflux system)
VDDSKRAAPGASVRVIVPLGQVTSAVVVPTTALRKGPAGDHVFVIAADEAGQARAHMRSVESGSVIGDQVVITRGLDAGEIVAAQGSFKLFESVAVVDGGAAAAGGGR